jgi:hypothetical protein
MKNQFLVKKVVAKSPAANIFANRSALVLHELLLQRTAEFRVRDLARRLELSHGLVQRVVSELLYIGVVLSEGVRTAKRYRVARPGLLLREWVDSYDISRKCKIYNYSCGFSASDIESKLHKMKHGRDQYPVVALHSAARAYKCGFTNLQSTELYCSSHKEREKLEELLRLEPRERGYDVLLIEPYYGAIVKQKSERINGLLVSSPILTFLDLYHFPLRGNEQAEHLLFKHPDLQDLGKALREELDERGKSR